MRNTVLDGIMGLCIGDACGVPVEGSTKNERKVKPVMDMIGYGTYFQPPGTWSDDTSMTLATLDSLCLGLNYDDMMNRYIDWYRNASYTAYDEVFDIGNVTRKALFNFEENKPAYECGLGRERDNGNGSLMRCLPIVYYVRGQYTDGVYLTDEGFEIVHKLSRMTHAHPISQIACGLYISLALFFLDASAPANGQEALRAAFRYYRKHPAFKGWIERFQRLEDLTEVEALPEKEIESTGYVVDTLLAALWSVYTTDNYRDCVLRAVNLGGDSDTVAAVAGGLAGLRYGYEAIPQKWRETLAKRDAIERLCGEYNRICLQKEMGIFETSIDYLRGKIGKSVCEWKGEDALTENVYHFSYPAYEQPIYELMENLIPHSLFFCSDYAKVFERKGFSSIENVTDALKTADVELCCAILSEYARNERFEEGYWNRISENGNLYAVLCKLKELL